MTDVRRELCVWCFGQLAGTLTETAGGARFEYAAEWLQATMPPLSHALPLNGSFSDEAAQAFFGGLLPEGAPREQLARRLGVSAANDFSLLAAVAGDTAGAISLRPPGEPAPAAEGEVDWLDDEQLGVVLDELPQRPMHADADGEYRLSLAGAQDKLPVVVDAAGRIGLTKGQTPSTHILKTPIERLVDTVVNEAFCPALGRALGIEAVVAHPRAVAGREFLLVERYDRSIDEAAVTRRLHQEDFCQALGIPAARKYEAEGGPSLADCFALLRDVAARPAAEVLSLLDQVALGFLVGNHDAHGKNFSLLYRPGSSRPVLAPAYDVISTVAYQRTHDLTRKMAMRIGGEYRPAYLKHRRLDRLIEEAGLGRAAARRRLRGHALAAPAKARALRAQFAQDGWDRPILDEILSVIDRRAAQLAELTA